MRRWLWLALLPLPALAAGEPVMYSRAQLVIMTQSENDASAHLPWQVPKGTSLEVEVRDAQSFRQAGMFNLGELSTPLLLTYPSPQIVTIERSNNFAPVDILFFADDGKLVQMLPAIALSELQAPISSAQPVVALLYLKGGAAESLKVKPGDAAEFSLFKKKPVVLNAPIPGAVPEKPAQPIQPEPPPPPVGQTPSLDDVLNQYQKKQP